MDAGAVQRALARMAHQLAERVDTTKVLLVGIHTGGVPLAKRLASAGAAIDGRDIPVGEIDITLYRDDLYTGLEKPILGETRLPVDLRGSTVVLVDDVLFTGRTVRAALDNLMDYGRPARIELAVLVDRGHRELPIEANYVGRRVETSKADRVTVRLIDTGADADAVVVERA